MKNSIVPAEFPQESLPALGGAASLPAPADVDWGAGATPVEDDHGNAAAKLARYWAAIKRFWWLVAGLTTFGTIVGVVATRFIDPVYEAHGAVWISDVSPNGGGGGGGPFRAPELLPNGSWIELIRSFAVVDRVVTKEHLFLSKTSWRDSAILEGLTPTYHTIAGDYTLYVNPTGTRYTLTEAKRGIVDRGVPGDSIGRPVGLAWVPSPALLPGKTVSFTVLQPRPIAIDLIKRLDVAMQENSNFLRLTLTGPDKWQTAHLLNVWMEEFVNKAAELRRQNLSDVARILDVQRASADTGLRQAEQALQLFRTSTITKPNEAATSSAAASGGAASDLLATDFFKTQGDYDNIRRDREALEAVAAAARQGTVSLDAITAIPSTTGDPALLQAAQELLAKEAELRKLQQTYTDSYKPVQDLLASIQLLRTQTIPTIASNDAELLRRHEAQLLGKIQADSLKLQSVPVRSIEEARLRRNLAVAENLYTNLENKYETTKLAAASTVPDVSILDPALPSAAPQRNTIIFLVLGGFGASLMFGVALALLLDLIDHHFRYPEQITHELRLDLLGAIPAVPKPGDGASDPEAMLQSVEAFRGLRMNLHHAFESPPVLLTVSSPGAGDGKSMVVSNLALSFSEAGYRTLLIDGDIRRGKLHAVFNVDRRPGLLDYLSGDAEVHTVMREVPAHGRLTIIPSGTRRHRGPELLTSARLPALLNTVRSRFDVILVDSAPLAAGIDAYALGVATGSMILVMRTGHTDRRVAKAKLKLAERLPIRMLGAVVNAVPPRGLYSEYSYLYGYAPDIEDMASADEVPVLQSADPKSKS